MPSEYQMEKQRDWIKKLHNSKDLPRVVKLTGKATKRWGAGTIVIPAPIEVDKLMRKVPGGKVVTITELREALAKKHKATIACPLTTGIFANIAARAAEQEREMGKKIVTPYWRTLKSDGSLNPKYPKGEEYQKQLLEMEGHKVIKKGKNYIVVDYQKSLATL